MEYDKSFSLTGGFSAILIICILDYYLSLTLLSFGVLGDLIWTLISSPLTADLFC